MTLTFQPNARIQKSDTLSVSKNISATVGRKKEEGFVSVSKFKGSLYGEWQETSEGLRDFSIFQC